MKKFNSTILTVVVSVVSFGLLATSVTFAAKDGDFLDVSPSWEVDLTGLTQQSVGSLDGRIRSSLPEKGPLRLSTFDFTFSSSGNMEEGLVFFNLSKDDDYQLKIERSSTKGEVRKRGAEHSELDIGEDVTSEIFSVISKASALTDAQERTYVSDGIYVSQGEILETGISGSIKNYTLANGELHLTDQLPSGEKYFRLTCSLLYSEKAEITARYFIEC